MRPSVSVLPRMTAWRTALLALGTISVYTLAALQKPEDDRFSTGATASLSPDPVRTEVGLVRFQGSDQGRLSFAGFRKPLPDPKEERIDGSDRKPRKG